MVEPEATDKNVTSNVVASKRKLFFTVCFPFQVGMHRDNVLTKPLVHRARR